MKNDPKKETSKSLPCAACGGTSDAAKELHVKIDAITHGVMICSGCALRHVSDILRFVATFLSHQKC